MYYVCGCVQTGANIAADQTFLFHEPARRRDLAVCPGCLSASQFHLIRYGQVLPVRVEQPPPLLGRVRRCRKPVFRVQQFLVHHGHVSPPGIRFEPQGRLSIN